MASCKLIYACEADPKNDKRELQIVAMYRYSGTAVIAQPDPKAANTQIHSHVLAADLLYIGNIVVNRPRSCIIELCTRSQKSTSVAAPGLLVALLQAKIIGIMQTATTRPMHAINVEFCYHMVLKSALFYIVCELLTFEYNCGYALKTVVWFSLAGGVYKGSGIPFPYGCLS